MAGHPWLPLSLPLQLRWTSNTSWLLLPHLTDTSSTNSTQICVTAYLPTPIASHPAPDATHQLVSMPPYPLLWVCPLVPPQELLLCCFIHDNSNKVSLRKGIVALFFPTYFTPLFQGFGSYIYFFIIFFIIRIINKLPHSFSLCHSCALHIIATWDWTFKCLIHYTFLGTLSSLLIHSYDCSPVQYPYLSIMGQLSIRKRFSLS